MMPCEHGYYGLCPQCVREERDELRSRVAKLERERDQLALSLSATRAERDHAVRSAELWESEHRAGYEAMGVYKHLWLEGRAIMAVAGYFSRMRGPVAMVLNDVHPFSSVYKVEWYTNYRDLPDGTKLYAGSAPVPAAQTDIAQIITAYKCGMTSGDRINQYAHGTPEHKAFTFGVEDRYHIDWQQAQSQPAAVPAAVAKARCNKCGGADYAPHELYCADHPDNTILSAGNEGGNDE